MIAREEYPVAVMPAIGNAPESESLLGNRLSIPVLTPDRSTELSCRIAVFYRAGALSLQMIGKEAPGPVCVDFEDESFSYRQRHVTQPEALLKAAGVKRGAACNVLDATAGLGQDAFVFASAGCHVTLVERSPVLHALLADGLRRAGYSEDADVLEATNRMRLLHADACALPLPHALDLPDVVYLDPMFPERRKSAKVKKNMFILQQLLADESASEGLLLMALGIARKRVVVKRPRHAEFLEGRKPSFQLTGKSSRFDVYVTQTAPLSPA